jgi:glycine/D-amino acid oxidase-like deaminating enzyme
VYVMRRPCQNCSSMSDAALPNDYDAIIIGAGVIGGAVAYELARRGHRTLSIDKGPGAGYGSTSASSAIIRFSYSTETGVAAAWDGMHYWKNWAEGVKLENQVLVTADGPELLTLFPLELQPTL